jgi:Flp pilus assembly protein TadB
MPMPLDPLPEPDFPPPDHVPDELVRMYGRDAQHSVRLSRTRRYRASKQVRQATKTFHDAELWAVAGLVFFWGVAGVALIGGLVYAVYLWPAAGIVLLGTVALIFAVSLAVGLRQVKRRREEPATLYTGFSL